MRISQTVLALSRKTGHNKSLNQPANRSEQVEQPVTTLVTGDKQVIHLPIFFSNTRGNEMDPIIVKCTTCDSEFQMGPNAYAGKWLPLYQMHVCSSCHSGNLDGFSIHYDIRIIKHLKDNGLPVPKRNERGYLPLA